MADASPSSSSSATPLPWLVPVMLVVGIVGISFGGILAKLADNAGVEPFTMAGWRCLIAAAVLPLLHLMRRRLSRNARTIGSASNGSRVKGLRIWVVAAGVCLGLHLGSWLWSLSDGKISVPGSVLLVTAHPVLVTLGAWAWLGERPRWRDTRSLTLALGGFLLATIPGVTISGWQLGGVLGSLFGAVAMAGYLLIGRRLRAMTGGAPLTDYIVPVYLVAGVLVILIAAATGEWATWRHLVGDPLLPGWPWMGLLWVALLAVIPMTMGHTVFNWALAHVPARTISTCYLGETFGATLLTLAVFGEVPSRWFVVGALLAIVGMAGLIRCGAPVKAPTAPPMETPNFGKAIDNKQ